MGHITLDGQIALNFQHCSFSRSKDMIGQLSRTEIIMMVTTNSKLMRFSCIKPLEAAVVSDKSCTGTVCFALLSILHALIVTKLSARTGLAERSVVSDLLQQVFLLPSLPLLQLTPTRAQRIPAVMYCWCICCKLLN